jgi:hypothetical protein
MIDEFPRGLSLINHDERYRRGGYLNEILSQKFTLTLKFDVNKRR